MSERSHQDYVMLMEGKCFDWRRDEKILWQEIETRCWCYQRSHDGKLHHLQQEMGNLTCLFGQLITMGSLTIVNLTIKITAKQ